MGRSICNNDKDISRDSIQRLMKIIINQGNTIQSQLKGLSEKEEAIDTFEERVHLHRVKESGRDYLLKTYLDQLPENKDLPVSKKQTQISSQKTKTSLSPHEIKEWISALENVYNINKEITVREEEMVKIHQNPKHLEDKQNKPPKVGPDLQNVLRLPKEQIEKELLKSEKEIAEALHTISTTHDELLKIELDLTFIKDRKTAGDIYIENLISDLDIAESEGVKLQKEFDWILSLPPSAFASKEILNWLKGDFFNGSAGDTDSELDLSPDQPMAELRSMEQSGIVLLPDQVHPSSSLPALPARSSSTGSTSSGFSSDSHSLVTPEPQPSAKLPKPRVIQKTKLSVKFADLGIGDCNSDTGLSSLNSSAEDQFQLDTLV